jgi:hypothetical protein
MVAAEREPARDGSANGIARANQDRNLRPIAHNNGCSPVSILSELYKTGADPEYLSTIMLQGVAAGRKAN